MRGSMLTGAVLALSCLVCLSLAETAMAQFGPYGSYSGGWGANPYAATARSADVSRQMASQRHAKTFDRGQQQMTNLQGQVRGMQTSEAQRRTASMGQHKSDYKDWWFTTQKQQFAQQQQRFAQSQARLPYRSAAAAPRETASTMQSAPPRNSTDIIGWPTILRNTQFAEQRARVEGPFRTQAAEGTAPTIEQYTGMVDATEKMKQILKDNAYEISAGDYMETEKFLDAMAAECQGRIDRRTTKEPVIEPSETPVASGDGDK
jgi:hypothetical protein